MQCCFWDSSNKLNSWHYPLHISIRRNNWATFSCIVFIILFVLTKILHGLKQIQYALSKFLKRVCVKFGVADGLPQAPLIKRKKTFTNWRYYNIYPHSSVKKCLCVQSLFIHAKCTLLRIGLSAIWLTRFTEQEVPLKWMEKWIVCLLFSYNSRCLDIDDFWHLFQFLGKGLILSIRLSFV